MGVSIPFPTSHNVGISCPESWDRRLRSHGTV